ncbi:SPOR domain-containing protein [Hespellia stercorisuis]|nr:SPOR domain-containing protein [Hespellia stercorisuis]
MPPSRPVTRPAPSGAVYHVQTGAFRNEVYAKRLLQELLSMDFPAFIQDSGGYYRVLVGSFDNLDDAADMENKLKSTGYATIIIL